MRGFDIGDIVWLKDGYGYQRFKLPATRVYSQREGRFLVPALKNSHVKVWWRRADGGRDFVGRADTVAKARALIKADKERRLPCL